MATLGGSERGQSRSGPDCGCSLQSRNQLGEGAGWPQADTITQARTKVCSKDSRLKRKMALLLPKRLVLVKSAVQPLELLSQPKSLAFFGRLQFRGG